MAGVRRPSRRRAHIDRAREKSTPDAPSLVVILGRPSLAETEEEVAAAARILAGLPGVAFLSGLRRSNVHGALDMGLAPGVLPGRVGLEAGRAWYEHQWGAALPATRPDDRRRSWPRPAEDGSAD